MTRARALHVLAVVFAAAFAAAAFAGDALSDYQKLYVKTAGTREREDVLQALVATGKPEAMKALQWCAAATKTWTDEARDKADKARAALAPIEAKIEKKETEYADQQKKQGNPNPKTRPKFPEDDELLKARSDVAQADKLVASLEMVLAEALDAHGALVAKMSPDAQKAVRDDWTKNRLGSKDWGLRAETYQILGHMPADWALDLLVAAVAGAEREPDARALVIAVDGLAGKDVAKAGPALIARIDDVRWLVRSAVVRALETTPSKDAVDAVVKRMAKEDGRLRDDCARALRALTGKDLPANAEMWRVYWEQAREKWAGKPPAADPKAAPDPLAGVGKAAAPEDPDKKTGFFGIEIESKRVVFVIDVSGSMNDPLGGKGPQAKSTKATLAKSELKRVIGALEDGALFDVVFFSSGVHVWRPEMQKADGKARKDALDFVDAIEVSGATDTYDALEAAFGLGDVGKGKKREADPTGDARVDTVMFLSDGKPTMGRTTEPDQIRAAVKGWNKARRIVIHAVAFGVNAKDGADPAFMKGLADDTCGKYVEM